jgi:hypothetical protein
LLLELIVLSTSNFGTTITAANTSAAAAAATAAATPPRLLAFLPSSLLFLYKLLSDTRLCTMGLIINLYPIIIYYPLFYYDYHSTLKMNILSYN